MDAKNEPWFRYTTIYQIYPRSFYDTTGDGTGDLNGIIQKLDYLKGKPSSLGIDTIWLSPFYPSPMADFGYDISNYCGVDPLFGTLKDFDHLLEEAHKRDIKVLIDFVPNHTSDHHPWFEDSKSSKHNPKRNWYVWRDPKPDGAPPNNWLSIFGGPAWQFDNNTNQYYLHSFLKEQPDLNWDNPAVRDAMKKAMIFWLDRGVDGFRIDAVQWLGKDLGLHDDPPNPDYNPRTDKIYNSLLHKYSKRSPEVFTHLKELAAVAKKYSDKLLVAEAYPHQRFGYEEYISLYEKVDPTILSPFNFEGIFLPWNAQTFKRYFDGFQAKLLPDYLPVYCMGNHDVPRMVARFGIRSARTIAMILLTLPGIPMIYYGDELGMDDVEMPLVRSKDPLAKRIMEKSGLDTAGRDPERTPMQWNGEKLSGFSRVAAWLPIGPNRKVNVGSELKDKNSLLNLYRELLRLRHLSPALLHGTYQPIECEHPDLFAYGREYQKERLVTVINFSRKATITCPIEGKVLISSRGDVTGNKLRPLEGRIFKV